MVLNDQATSGGEQLTQVVPCTPVQTSTPPPPAPIGATPDPSQEVAAPSVAQPPPAPAKKTGPAIQGPRPPKKGS